MKRIGHQACKINIHQQSMTISRNASCRGIGSRLQFIRQRKKLNLQNSIHTNYEPVLTYAACENTDEKLSRGVRQVKQDEDQKPLARPVSRPQNARQQPPESIIRKILRVLGILPQNYLIFAMHGLLPPPTLTTRGSGTPDRDIHSTKRVRRLGGYISRQPESRPPRQEGGLPQKRGVRRQNPALLLLRNILELRTRFQGSGGSGKGIAPGHRSESPWLRMRSREQRRRRVRGRFKRERNKSGRSRRRLHRFLTQFFPSFATTAAATDHLHTKEKAIDIVLRSHRSLCAKSSQSSISLPLRLSVFDTETLVSCSGSGNTHWLTLSQIHGIPRSQMAILTDSLGANEDFSFQSPTN